MSETAGARLVLLARDLDPASAEVLRGLLEAQEIPAILSRESAGSLFPVNVGVFGLVDVLIPEAKWDDALQILETFRGSEIDPDESEAD
ncbi:MAG TPA: DUF2007 domain-containing protein [Anaerolineales bacterium]|nr:DUF2007 domain-containing protein [Anaerolineales bacterium]